MANELKPCPYWMDELRKILREDMENFHKLRILTCVEEFYRNSLNTRPTAPVEALEEAAKDAVESLFKDLRDRRFLKWLFDERGDECLIGFFGDGSELRGIDLEAQQEIRRAWQQIIERTLCSTCGATRPTGGVNHGE